MSLVNFENFYAECVFAGKRSGGFFHIAKGSAEALDRWLDYCDRKATSDRDRRWGARATFLRRCVEMGQGVTMPCADPEDFDPGVYRGRPYRPMGRPFQHPGAGKTEDREHRAGVVAAWRTRREVKTAEHAMRPPRREPSPTYVETPGDHLAIIADEMRAPLAATPALVASWGQR